MITPIEEYSIGEEVLISWNKIKAQIIAIDISWNVVVVTAYKRDVESSAVVWQPYTTNRVQARFHYSYIKKLSTSTITLDELIENLKTEL